MKQKVTDAGVTIPREMLDDAEEVEIRRENGRIVVEPLPRRDAILGLGERPVMTGLPDGAASHDAHLYGADG